MRKQRQKSVQSFDFQPLEPTTQDAHPQSSPKEKDTVMHWISRELTKPAYKGLASIPDLPVVLGNLLVSGMNKFAGTNIPPGKLPSDYVGEAVDYATGGLSQGEPESMAGKAMEFGASTVGGGALAQGAKALLPGSKVVDKVAPFLGSTDKKVVASAAGLGATSKSTGRICWTGSNHQ